MKILSKMLGSLAKTPRGGIPERQVAEQPTTQDAEDNVPRRVLVLGVIAPAPATSFLWTEIPENISIADYDTVILDLTQFEKPKTTEFRNAYLPESDKFARLFFQKNSEIIAIGRPDIKFDRSIRGLRGFQYTSWWMPRYFPEIESREEGQDFSVVQSEYSSYLDSSRKWSYYWKSTIDSQTPTMYHPYQYGDYLGPVNLAGHQIQVRMEPIATTRFGGLIAFEMQYHVLHRQTGESLAISGNMVFLPPPTELSTDDAIAVLLRERYKIGINKEPPRWAQEYSLPRIDAARRAMESIQNKIAQLTLDYERATVEIQQESRFLGLLYGQGDDELEPLVREALRILGAQVIDPQRRGQEDGRLIDPYGRKAALEIKGRDNQLPLKDVRQLVDWVSQLKPEGWDKGILIANLFRNSPPSERENVYGSNSLQRASMNDLALVTTTQLFRALQSHQAGTLDLQQFWDALFRASGPCSLPELE